MKMNRFYRKEMVACRSLAKAFDRIPHWVVAIVYALVMTGGIFWYA